tara:strand:+ start:1101 stop:1301 length:201 start_codon:yes stop_codon:yes gene_type:complete
MACNRKKKLKFDDRLESKEHRSQIKRESKNQRHQTKTMLHNCTGSSLDADEYFDIIGELENPEWSD